VVVLTGSSLGLFPPPSVKGAAEVEVCPGSRVEVKLKGEVELRVRVGPELVIMIVFEFEESPRGPTSGSEG
jgi:hypothetical protein